ncbi:hypothetical protein [Tenacibaculum aiptasiae]|uniref:hypothetical protein n=1 Tax=Tenacibaculum aiptasiae TaxID=426481 RepID=UPI003B58E405
MKKRILILIIVFTFQYSIAQNGEFEIQENGLIYSESTINKLKKVVDSLNLNFKTCNVQKKFKSKYQIVGHKINIEKHNVKEAKRDIENNIDIDLFQKKYPKAKITRNVLIVKYNYKNYQNKDVVEFTMINLNNGYNSKLKFNKKTDKYKVENLSKWIFKYHKKDSYSEEEISAFYFPNKMESKTLPVQYAKMISYADCLIDTTTTKFKDDLKFGRVDLPKNWKKQHKKKQEKLLDKLRSTRVVGSCSQDSRPRKHAINIAMVSAETQNWKIFLRAHLDVMNDRFERVSDGSYAFGERKTYIKELEELNINVLDLIIGTSLRVENPSENHYNGDIRRIGRALSETKNKSKVENQLFEIIENKKLDLYNRVLCFYIMKNYIYNHIEQNEKNRLKTKLKRSIKNFPEEFYKQIKI